VPDADATDESSDPNGPHASIALDVICCLGAERDFVFGSVEHRVMISLLIHTRPRLSDLQFLPVAMRANQLLDLGPAAT
jgi:hypothetical protein